MNRSSVLVKAAALTSSLLLVGVFVASRAGLLETSQTSKTIELVALPQFQNAVFAFEFQVEGDAGFSNSLLNRESGSDHWVEGFNHDDQESAMLKVSTLALKLLDDELRARATEEDPTIMPGSKVAIIPWKFRGVRHPLIVGQYAAKLTAGAVVPNDESPIKMFDHEANPLIRVAPDLKLSSATEFPVLGIPSMQLRPSSPRPPRVPLGDPEPHLTVLSGSKSGILIRTDDLTSSDSRNEPHPR